MRSKDTYDAISSAVEIKVEPCRFATHSGQKLCQKIECINLDSKLTIFTRLS